MKGKTSTGFEFDIEDERLDDMELVDIMAEIDENPLLMPKLCKMLLGEEQKKRLYDHLRSEDGRVPIEATTNAIQEIFDSPGDLKNS
ncbi:MAG: hypothetical protein ACLVMI_02615 [Clostridia bacterium]